MENNVDNQNKLPNVGYHTHNDADGTPSLWRKQSAITKPTGGSNIDTEARTAINEIIDKLKLLGFTT
jgi:hypothetical protein